MTLQDDVSLLRALPLFAGFNDEQLRLIAFSAEALSLPGGTTLFREGAPAETAYIVVSGAVHFLKNGEEAGHDDVGPGGMIGEMALLCQTSRGVTAVTVGDSRFMVISRRLFRRVLMEYPEMAAGMRRTMAERLTEMSADLARARHALLSIGDDR
ncbi:Crp/Fnr family transcriptional regulator [Lutibaculum baratangense]|uniref:Cyclic nucleotide-binding domain-containing protein n=1 Tax=Lutibaculum baratangense AMV1 TaxID=631454 RepID=V4RLB3_9HYPH|nr:Crp/Fnr family transcriptional regulator [Lutibaculum baratangense]ESR26099.1 hypothetical protein N177_1434 [Lutibaculum baratangense AMV1]